MNVPPLYRKIMPNPMKTKIIPMQENQTRHPTKHLKRNIQTRETTRAMPKPARSHCQFYDYDICTFLTSVIRLANSPSWRELVMELAAEDSPLESTVAVGKQTLSNAKVVS